jgi:hypothetical protein
VIKQSEVVSYWGPDTPKIHRLRVIYLYEADYNLILAVKWRQTLHHACKHNLINPSQYGSQPGKEATDALMLRELEYEMGRITRKACLHFDNDATSCYDRIPCALANIMSWKYGLHRKVCIVQGRILEDAKYHLKTKLRVSDEFIQHCKAFPIFGTGQLSGYLSAALFLTSRIDWPPAPLTKHGTDRWNWSSKLSGSWMTSALAPMILTTCKCNSPGMSSMTVWKSEIRKSQWEWWPLDMWSAISKESVRASLDLTARL